MAQAPYYIYDLPFQPRRELCRILDADHRWEELGGIHMHIDITTLTLIGQAVQRDKSPTWEVLSKLSEKNGTISQLFIMLAKMGHLRGMKVLQPYVDRKYDKLLEPENMVTASFMTRLTEKDLPKPPYSMASFTSDQSARLYTQNSKEKNSPSPRHEKKASAFSSSKFQNDTVNINQDQSALSFLSKLNSLNVHQPSKTQYSPGRKSPDSRQYKQEDVAYCREESIIDNCASEKIKNVRKTSPTPEGAAFQQKNLKHSPRKNSGDNLNTVEENLPDVMKISYMDILIATKDFDKSRILGRGGFGTVYKGEWKGTSVAIKRLTPREGHDSASKQVVSLKQSLNELNILKRCRFDHILPLYGVSLDGLEPCLVYQLMVNGSLEDRLLCRNNTLPLTWSQRSNIAECTTKGLNYLHTTPGKPLVHGDVKSANILLDSNMEAKIGDFGLTREGPGCEDTHVKVSKLHGTECYLPPEYLRQRHLSPQVDVYSYGIVLLEMATGLRPYDVSRDEAKLLVDYVSDCDTSGRLDSLRDTKAGEENMMWFRELIQVGQKCSSKEKKKRPTMLMVLEHFEKVKNDISMMDKIRRLSNDKGTLGDATKLKQLTPRELQIFYDLYNNKYGTTPCGASSDNSHSPHQFQNDPSFLPVSGLQDVQGPPSDTFHASEIRAPPSLDAMDYKGALVLPMNDGSLNSSCVATVGSCQSIESNNSNPTPNAEDQFSEAKVPLPLLTVLQLQVSEINENNSEISYNSDSGNTNSNSFSDLSSSEYSKDFFLAMASAKYSNN